MMLKMSAEEAASAWFEERLDYLESPEVVVVIDVFDKLTSARLMLQRDGVPFTASDLETSAKWISKQERIDARALANEVELAPLEGNVVIFSAVG